MKKLTLLLVSLLTLSVYAQEKSTKQVFISPNVVFIEVVHNGKTIKLQRNQNKDNKISSFYLKTARGKIKYFRGGMQNWKALGLTTVNL